MLQHLSLSKRVLLWRGLVINYVVEGGALSITTFQNFRRFTEIFENLSRGRKTDQSIRLVDNQQEGLHLID